MRSLLTASLEGLDLPLRISEAASGFEALACLPRDPVDLIVTDINMPDINGLELVAFVRKSPAYQSTPLIIISTEGSERDRRKGLELGADAYLVKPIDPNELQRLARELLSKPRAEE